MVSCRLRAALRASLRDGFASLDTAPHSQGFSAGEEDGGRAGSDLFERHGRPPSTSAGRGSLTRAPAVRRTQPGRGRTPRSDPNRNDAASSPRPIHPADP
jgi:hypothetical protein